LGLWVDDAVEMAWLAEMLICAGVELGGKMLPDWDEDEFLVVFSVLNNPVAEVDVSGVGMVMIGVRTRIVWNRTWEAGLMLWWGEWILRGLTSGPERDRLYDISDALKLLEKELGRLDKVKGVNGLGIARFWHCTAKVEFCSDWRGQLFEELTSEAESGIGKQVFDETKLAEKELGQTDEVKGVIGSERLSFSALELEVDLEWSDDIWLCEEKWSDCGSCIFRHRLVELKLPEKESRETEHGKAFIGSLEWSKSSLERFWVGNGWKWVAMRLFSWFLK
jgi:hypothetical protein